MRNNTLHLIFFLLVAVAVGPMYGQQPQTIKLPQLETAPSVEGSRAGQIGLTDSNGKQRYGQYTEINLIPISYVPASTGNTLNLSEFVVAPGDSIWYIDWQGRGLFLSAIGGAADDKNGYYGGNSGNGGDGTVPSVTQSHITNQLTLQTGESELFDLVPFRIQVDSFGAGRDMDFMSFRNGPDSLYIFRQDDAFKLFCTQVLAIISTTTVELVADSVRVSAIPNNFPGERTFVTQSPLGYLTKQEGVSWLDLDEAVRDSILNAGLFANEGATMSGDTVQLGSLHEEGGGVDFNILRERTIASTGGDLGSAAIAFNNNSLGYPFAIVSTIDSTSMAEALDGSYQDAAVFVIDGSSITSYVDNDANTSRIQQTPARLLLTASLTSFSSSNVDIKNDGNLILSVRNTNLLHLEEDSTTSTKKITLTVPQTNPNENELITRKWAVDNLGGGITAADQGVTVSGGVAQLGSVYTAGGAIGHNVVGNRIVSGHGGTDGYWNGLVFGGPSGLSMYSAVDSAGLVEALNTGSSDASSVGVGSDYSYISTRSNGGLSSSGFTTLDGQARISVSNGILTNQILSTKDSTTTTKKISILYSQTNPTDPELITRGWADAHYSTSGISYANQGARLSGDTVQVGNPRVSAGAFVQNFRTGVERTLIGKMASTYAGMSFANADNGAPLFLCASPDSVKFQAALDGSFLDQASMYFRGTKAQITAAGAGFDTYSYLQVVTTGIGATTLQGTTEQGWALQQGQATLYVIGDTGSPANQNAMFMVNDSTHFRKPVTIVGNLELKDAGSKLKIYTGSNASLGTATLVAGTVTVSTTAIKTSSKIFVSVATSSGTTIGVRIEAPPASIINGTSFVINAKTALNALETNDTSTVNWWIIN